jgi:prepilin-type N-terminal cleavage/methylation domain-containing protein
MASLVAKVRTPISPAGNRGFGLIEVLVALVLLGLGLASVFQLVNMQATAQTKAKLQMAALRDAQNLMDQWLDAPKVKPGSYQGNTDSGMAWRIQVRPVAGSAPKPRPGAKTSQSSRAGLNRPTSRRLPLLLELSVCCSYELMGRTRRVCLVSQRIAEGEM